MLASVPTISINDVQQMEGDTGTTDFAFTLVRDGRTNKPSVIDYNTSLGSATPNEDYQPTSGSVSFERGEVSKIITVTVFGDGDDEGDETFFVDLTNPQGASLGDSHAVGTIVNDDAPLLLSISDATLAEAGAASEGFVAAGSGGVSGPASITVGPDGNLYVVNLLNNSIGRYNGSTGDFIDVFVSSGSGGLERPRDATFGPDGNLYVTSQNTNSVLRYHGSTGTFIDEFISSGSENLQNPRGLLFSDDGVLYVTSVDSDGATQGTGDAILSYDASTGEFLSVFVSPGSGGLDNPTHMAFGPDGNFYVSSTSTTSNSVLRYDSSSGAFVDTFVTAGSGGLDGPVDLLFHTDGFLYVTSWRSDRVLRYDGTTGSFAGTVIDSFVQEVNEPSGLASSRDGNIFVSSYARNEIRRLSQTISVELSASSEQTVTVGYSSADGTALAGTDYAAANGTLTFAPGETTKRILLVANDDAAIESYETFTVALANVTGSAMIADGLGLVTITDDDSARQITINDSTTYEGDDTPHFRGNFVSGSVGGHFNPLTFGPDGNGDGIGDLYTAVGTGIGYNTIQRYDGATGAFLDTFMTNDGEHKIDGVRDIVFHTDGYVYVASAYTDEVLRYEASTGNFVDVFVTANSGGIDHPDGMVFADPQGQGRLDLFVTGWLSHSVVRYHGVTGEPLGTYISTNSGGLSYPFALAFGPADNYVYVTSAGTNEILKYDAETGAYVGAAVTTELDYPRGLLFGPDGLMYVSSGDDDRIVRFTSDGTFVDDFVPAGRSELDNPRSMVFRDGDLYVTATGNREILRYGTQSEAVFTVSLSTTSNLPVTVDFQTADGADPNGATAGADYTTTTGTMIFPPAVVERTVLVPILDDSDPESSESFSVLLENTTGGVIGVGQGVGTIVDDDQASPNVIYVYDITFDSRQRGPHTDYQVVVDVRQDSNGLAEASDPGLAGVEVTVVFAGQTLTGFTDSNGIFRSDWVKELGSGNYTAEVTDLALLGYLWDPFDILDATSNDDDEDGDGLPDDVLSI